MKTLKQIAYSLFIGIFSVLFSISNSVAQDKPKGKEWNVPATDAKKKSPIKFDDANVKAGKDIWSKECKSCHGVKGLGDGAKAEKIDISCGDFSVSEMQNMSDGAIFWKTTEGRKPMPSFKEKLTDTERWQVLSFIRTLKKGGATTTTTTVTTTSTTKTPDINQTKKEEVSIVKDSVITIVEIKTEKSDISDTTNISIIELQQMKTDIDVLKKEVSELKLQLNSMKEEKEKK